jgi:AcrR family transcriptional regulator
MRGVGEPRKKREHKAAPAPARRRVRRSPEEARALILDAAERVYRTELPDRVGLKEIARTAGVSHALVSHYFGTYEALVEATLERRVATMREEMVGSAMRAFEKDGSAASLLTEYRHALERVAEDPVTLRLALWALLSGRVDAHDFFPGQRQGMRIIAEALMARSPAGTSRAQIDFSLIASFGMTVTWVFGKRALLAALGRKHTRDEDAWFDEELGHMLARYRR